MFLDEYCARNNVSLQPQIEIGSMDFLIEFARIGLGIACVIKNFVREELEQKLLYEVPVYPAIPPRQIGLVRHKNVPVSNAADAFMSFLKKGGDSTDITGKSVCRIEMLTEASNSPQSPLPEAHVSQAPPDIRWR